MIADIVNTSGSLAWGDFDNGTLDVAQDPYSFAQDPPFPARVLVNYGATPTTRPDAPTGLTTRILRRHQCSTLVGHVNDDNTPTAGLTYTVRVGTTPGGNDVISAPALADGTRLVSAPGAYSQAFADVTGLVGGVTYYWEVQSVDATLGVPCFPADRSSSTTHRLRTTVCFYE